MKPKLSDKQIKRIAKSIKGQEEKVPSTGYTTRITEIPDPEGIYESTYSFDITLTGLGDLTLSFKFGSYEEAENLGRAISDHIGFTAQ